ncbi:hypothetical protein A1O3_03267 [Capronia epimyces CBS 606.96]|uniref:Uncharacterized protein n=1 Tax=Capronia epimyces CBS 606.96 TaxID=1182542 RepID=W9YAM2_9EURO|nr:uncharacterized protein A1O3_03267 [Capronia epimyces CBS 606.96]EXJ86316.1 hypothetical protein A1O3_03267 [Capronia epimyces CBS 606.96]
MEKVHKLKFGFAAKRVVEQDEGITTFFENLRPFRLVTIKYPYHGKLVRRKPDLRLDLFNRSQLQPALVVETSYAQPEEDMKAKLKEYIDCTNGEILTAVGCNLDYPAAQGIRVTVLRAQFNDGGIYTGASEETLEIRTAEGSVGPVSEALNLSLYDLGLPFPKTNTDLLQEPRLLVSTNELCHWVDRAVEREEAADAAAAASLTLGNK